MKIITTAALLLLSTAARADVFLTRNVHIDATTNANGETTPPKDEVQTTWIAKDKVRAETGGVAYIVRLDQHKLYMVNPNAKTYAVLDLPVDLSRYVSAEERRAYDALSESVHVTATVNTSEETERIHGWGAKKFVVQLRYPAGGSVDTIWTTTDIEMDTTTYWAAMSAVYSLRPGGPALVEELKKTQGITVKAERVRTIGTQQARTTEELATVERKDAPAGTYEVPSDFKETPYNAIQYLRMVRKSMGPVEAPAKDDEATGGKRGGVAPAGEGKRRGDGKGGEEPKKGGGERKRPE